MLAVTIPALMVALARLRSTAEAYPIGARSSAIATKSSAR